MLLRFLSSLRVTLALLLGLALVSVFGTLQPMAQGRYDLFYQSPAFRLLLTLLALQLTVCTLKTIRRNCRDRERFQEILGSEQVFALPRRYVLPRHLDLTALGRVLRRQGYRIDAKSDRVLARRGLAGRWGSTVIHLSVLAIMLGALSAELGFVGTLNIYVGDTSETYFDWDHQKDRPLGFTFRLDHFEPIYYPIKLRFAAVDRRTNRVITTFTTREGESVDLPAPELTAKVLKFLPEEEHLILELSRRGRKVGEYHALGGGRENPASFGLDFELRPVAYRDPLLKQLHSEVSILENGRVVQQGVIEINQPLTHRGITIYQTAHNRDKFGFWFAGFQFVRDPGEPVVWAGCVILVLGLMLAFLVPYRAVGVSRIDDELMLVALHGFRGERGEHSFTTLEQRLNPSEEDRTP